MIPRYRRRPHFPLGEQWIGVGKGILFYWCHTQHRSSMVMIRPDYYYCYYSYDFFNILGPPSQSRKHEN